MCSCHCKIRFYYLTGIFYLYRTLSSEWKVDVGVHSRSAMESNQKTYNVREIVSHENFNPYLLENDIAIVRLTTNVTENEAVKPICITTIPTSDFYGKHCVVTGWGATVEGIINILIFISHCLFS